MKKLFIPAVLAVILTTACGRVPAKLEDLILVTVEENIEAIPDPFPEEFKGEEISGSASISLEIPKGGLRAKAAKLIRDSIITTALGPEYRGKKCTKAVSSYLKRYASEYLQDFREIYGTENAPAMAYAFNCYEDIDGEFVSLAHGVLCYRLNVDSYSGGAHGLNSEIYLNFRATDGELLRAADIFTENGRESLDYMIKSELQAEGHNFWDYRDDPTGWLDGNFKLGEGEIDFCFNPYEVDCYAAGIITVSIPIEKAAPLLDEKKLKLNLENSD